MQKTDLLVRMKEILDRKQMFVSEQLQECDFYIQEKERAFQPMSLVATHTSDALKFLKKEYVELLMNKDEYKKTSESIDVGLELLNAIEQAPNENSEKKLSLNRLIGSMMLDRFSSDLSSKPVIELKRRAFEDKQQFQMLISELRILIATKLALPDLFSRMRDVLNKNITFFREKLEECELRIKQYEMTLLPTPEKFESLVATLASDEVYRTSWKSWRF